MQYIISLADKKISKRPEEYVFPSEDLIQEILAGNPEIVLNIPELEVEGDIDAIACREFPTGRGSIDVMYVTSEGEIIFVETKLIRNPEATRTVVAQAIDYIKALCHFRTDDFLNKIEQRNADGQGFEFDEKFKQQLTQTLQHGYFKVVILGDYINPNILGMVESIQAAPHLSFSIHLVEINARSFGEEIAISPRVVSKTIQVERSVIKLELNLPRDQVLISSEIPEREREGNKPKKTWEEYIATVASQRFAPIIEKFKNNWEEVSPGSINMGMVGFSAGVYLGEKRIPIQFVYNDRLSVMSRSQKDKYNIPEPVYEEYIEEIRRLSDIYDKYVVGERVYVPFSEITEDELENIFAAALNIEKKLLDEST